jgi:hypothetical protein
MRSFLGDEGLLFECFGGQSVPTDNLLGLIGNTPLLRLKNERILAKAEFFNPGGSIKDRVALAMLEAARRGLNWNPIPWALFQHGFDVAGSPCFDKRA